MTEKILSVDDLSNADVEIVKVPLDDKGGVMFIGSLSADEFAEWVDARDSATGEAKKDAATKLITQSLVRGEKDATRIGTPDMVAKFRKAKVAKTERLLKAIHKLNNLSQKDEAAIKNA